MSTQGEIPTIGDLIDRIEDGIESAYVALEVKGATMPASKTSANLAPAIATIDTGNASVTYNHSTHILEITVR